MFLYKACSSCLDMKLIRFRLYTYKFVLVQIYPVIVNKLPNLLGGSEHAEI